MFEPPLGREEEDEAKMPPNPRIRPPEDRECMDAEVGAEPPGSAVCA